MPVSAVPGAAAAARVADAATPVTPPAVAAASRPAGPVDVVSLSPAALVRQALDTPVLAMRLLDGLLLESGQVAGLSRPATPGAIGILAGDIGAAARDLGAGVRTLLPAADAAAPLRPGADAVLRVLAALAPASPTSAGVRVSGGAAPDPDRPGIPPSGTAPTAGVPPVRLPDARSSDAPFQPGPAPPDPALSAPARQAREAVATLLGEAAAALEGMRLCPHAAPAAADPARDEAWCEAQIAAALGSVARAAQAVDCIRPAAPAGIAALLAGRADTPQDAARVLRLGNGAALLCCLGAALWATQALDLGTARALTAAALAGAAAAWAWRRAAWRRVRVQMRR